MAFSREISRLMFGLLIAFFIVIGSASYWAIVGADSILLREDNPRLVEDEANIQRGSIYDKNDILLAETVPVEDDFPERVYYHPETYSALGYFSFRYGTSNVEAAYNDYLRGDIIEDELNDFVEQDLLHLLQQGADIRLTLDTAVQQSIVSEMADYRGAAVVLSVPDGAILGLVSLPDYDPNTLDENWETLIEADGNPFFNRVIQGQYQPGGMLQTPLMVAGILTDQAFDVVTADANRAVTVGDDMQLNCAMPPLSSDLTYTEAYAYGCPFPFSLLVGQLSPVSLQNIFGAFRLTSPPIITGFASNGTEITEVTPEVIQELSLVEDIIGQGQLTINPLGMATIAGAVINAGNAPQPYMLEDYRLPGEDEWQAVNFAEVSVPLMTANAARRLRALMMENTSTGASVPAARPPLSIGGHTALAISGDETQAWFIGYVTLDDNRGATIAIVLENSVDASEVARIGGLVLESAVASLQ